MRPHLLLAVLCVLLVLRFGNLPVQDSGNHNQAPQTQMLAFLSPPDREKFLADRMKALHDHPDLQAEDEALQQRPGAGASPQDLGAYPEKWMAHQQKLRQIMLQNDPSLVSIFNQIGTHLAQMSVQPKIGMVGSASFH